MSYSYKQFIDGWRTTLRTVAPGRSYILPRTEGEAYDYACQLKENKVRASWYGIGEILARQYAMYGKF